MQTDSASLPLSSETGSLGLMHLKRYWAKSMLKRTGAVHFDAFKDEWQTDVTLLRAIGLGLEPTIAFLFREAPSFEAFEQHILDIHHGNVPHQRIEKFNRLLLNGGSKNQESIQQVLTAEELACWETNGYVIIRNAISKEDCDATIKVLCDFLNIDRNDPQTWYQPNNAKQGIMVQLFQHPVLEKNRHSDKIRQAYEQLWNRTDIWVTTDRVGFNPPENAQWTFPGPYLHWDVSLNIPIPFGLQGILYLADTAENQGAFTMVPGFHHRIENWLQQLPEGADPRNEDLYALGAKPLAANAGDFIIWHQALPHGSSRNTSQLPRIVQYINYQPVDLALKDWR